MSTLSCSARSRPTLVPGKVSRRSGPRLHCWLLTGDRDRRFRKSRKAGREEEGDGPLSPGKAGCPPPPRGRPSFRALFCAWRRGRGVAEGRGPCGAAAGSCGRTPGEEEEVCSGRASCRRHWPAGLSVARACGCKEEGAAAPAGRAGGGG